MARKVKKIDLKKAEKAVRKDFDARIVAKRKTGMSLTKTEKKYG